MSTFIICGNPWFDTEIGKKIFNTFGIADSATVLNSQIADIHTWHKHLFTSEGSDISASIKPGKAWELAAGEIFLGNWNQPLWGWVDSSSTLVLDFWHDFDPNIYFIFIHTTPQEALASVIRSSIKTDFHADEVLKQWSLYTIEMLKFRNKYPERCLLIETPKEGENHQIWIEKIAEKINMVPIGNFSEDDTLLNKSDGALKTISTLFAQKTVEMYPNCETINWEVEACLDVVSSIADNKSDFFSSDIVFQELFALIAQSEELETSKRLITALEAEKETSKKLITALEAEKETLNIEKSLLSRELNDTHKILEQEGEILLLQLHQAQEELEYYFLQYQEGQKQIQMVQNNLKKITARYPDYSQWKDIKIISAEQSDKTISIKWGINGLTTGTRNIPDFEVTTLLIGGYPVMIFEDKSLFSEKIISSQIDKITIFPSAVQNISSPAFIQLAHFSTSDIHMIQTIAYAIKQSIELSKQTENGIHTELWNKVMDLFLQDLNTLPKILRFDSIALKTETVHPGYEHLWVSMEHLSFGMRYWPTFEFRLGAALVEEDKFSTHPRLEFPMIGEEKPFDSWYEESEDEFGKKYELRFEISRYEMDIETWQQLEDSDQELIRAIVKQLPTIINELKINSIAREWGDWEYIAEKIEKVFIDITEGLLV